MAEEKEGESTQSRQGTMGAVGSAPVCMDKETHNQRATPQISDVEYLESGECFECPNRCGAAIVRVRIDGKKVTIGKACES